MNSLNSSSVDARVETAIAGAEREGEAETGISEAGRADAGTLAINIVFVLIDRGIVVFGSEGAELIEREDLWELLADPIEQTTTSLLAIF